MNELGFSQTKKILSCPNCYYGFNWNGSLIDLECPNCKKVIPVIRLAESLIHLFSAQHQEAYEILKYLSEHGWGDAMYVGRHDWILSGCPKNLDEICNVIENGNELELTSISRLLSSQNLPQYFKENFSKIGESALFRLSNGESNYLLRERLYYLLNNFPSSNATTVLENIKKQYPEIDGDSTSPVGAALEDALISCKKY